MRRILVLVLVLCGAGLLWSSKSSKVGAAQDNAVQVVAGGQPVKRTVTEKGETYYALEAQTKRLTTTFSNGYIATAERDLVGGVKTALHDQAGNEVARLRKDHDVVTYDAAGKGPLQIAGGPSAKPTLDWATRQAYGLARDGASNLIWENGTMRPRAAAGRNVDNEATEVVTEWANGLTATLTRETYSKRQLAPGIVVEGPALVSQLRSNGVQVGFGVWFISQQIYAYSLPTIGPNATVISAKQLERYGGWGFAPDTTWVNIQTLALYQFKSEAKTKGLIAKGCEPARPNTLAQFFFPTVQANDLGCDRLHWYDGTILRMCCDEHDRCYAQYGCTERSWWHWGNWSCDNCNLQVAWCFEIVATAPCMLMRLAC